MRIAEVAPLFESVPPHQYGGTERVVSWLTEELVRQGHDVTLVASGDSETSARIIAAHVKDGVDLGHEHGLPVPVIGFIPQHHGTSVMSYFYGKALREAGGAEDSVKRDRFRYPGPKPQSREAAILMLADGVEASVRSLESKDEASIRAMVDSIVDARLADGQLDDAELTLKNLSQINEAFVQQLLGMYHSRIQYPDNVRPLEQRREAGTGRGA